MAETGQLGALQSYLTNIVLGGDAELQDTGDIQTELYFLPPLPGGYHLPPQKRLNKLNVPRSRIFRYAFYRTQNVLSVELNGFTYLGGRWSGPLTVDQANDLIAAGYAERIHLASDPGLLPVLDLT